MEAKRERSVLGSVSNGLERAVVYVTMISVGAMTLDLIVAVFYRYLFRQPIVWADELALFLLVWVTFLGAALSIKRHEMVAVTVFIERLKGWPAKGSQVFIQLLLLLFSFLLLYYGYQWASSPNIVRSTSAAMQLPMWIPYLMFPLSMLVTIIFCLDNIRKIFVKREKSDKDDA